MPLLTVVMSQIRSSLSTSTVFLVYLIAILALTTWAGALVGIVGALLASGLENYFFVKPLHTLEVARPDDVVAIVAYLLFAMAASLIVNRFTREFPPGGTGPRGGPDPRRGRSQCRRFPRGPLATARIATSGLRGIERGARDAA